MEKMITAHAWFSSFCLLTALSYATRLIMLIGISLEILLLVSPDLFQLPTFPVFLLTVCNTWNPVCDFTSGDMDGQQGHKNPSMSLNSRGSATAYDYDLCYGHVYNPNPVIPMAAGRTNNHSSPLSLSQWIEGPKTPHSYVEFLRENIEKAPSADVLESIGYPVGGIPAIDGISEIQRELLHNNAGKANFISGPNDYPLDQSEHGKLKLSATHTINPSNHEASASGRFLRPHDRPSVNRFSSSGFDESHAQQNHTYLKQEPNEYDCKVFQLQAKENMSAPSFLCQPHHCVPKPKASGSDRQRRLRIAESVRALQELLPNSAEHDQATAVDDIIDHIKFLQFQIKELTRSRLGGEPAYPFDYFKGCGHYSLHEQTMNEPLEEMMGKLLEINPLAATQLFERKGLYMMPWTLVDGLHRAT
ncbi:hypothetical protein CCACVL1_14843 [Corchorus capsularis]|uniref:BHLH domain-containing protein n=1 Tax=Corchorus capsularis TaxID=210143 RepID=A0A1R3I5A0_COCAP|nr:hypothetical protein CCACVL1_14843 [Corchorus capsularis]